MRLTTLGDVLLDVVAHLDEPLAPDDDRMATTRVGAGGQAANVAAWAASLGAAALLVDPARRRRGRRLVVGGLRGHGVEVAGPVEGRTGVVVAIAAAGPRTMVSDRGSAPRLCADELEPRGSSLRLAARRRLRAAARSDRLGRRCWPAPSRASPARRVARPLVVEADRRRVRRRAASARTRRRVRGRAGVRGARRAGRALGREAGRGGVVVDGVSYPARARRVVDSTGAGDAFAAGFLVGGLELGLEAAARCFAQLGAMP